MFTATAGLTGGASLPFSFLLSAAKPEGQGSSLVGILNGAMKYSERPSDFLHHLDRRQGVPSASGRSSQRGFHTDHRRSSKYTPKFGSRQARRSWHRGHFPDDVMHRWLTRSGTRPGIISTALCSPLSAGCSLSPILSSSDGFSPPP